MKRVLKWNVPVDDQRHKIGSGPVVHVASQHGLSDVVQVWTEETGSRYTSRHVDAQVYGTDHPYPEEGMAVGSVVTSGGRLVWHVVTFPKPKPTVTIINS